MYFCKQWKEKGYYEYEMNGRVANIHCTVVESAKSYNALYVANNISTHTLFVSAENDRVIEEKDVQKKADFMKAKIVKIDESAHNFATKQNQTDLYQAIFDFVE